MDIEWAKDGFTNELFSLQARPETVHSQLNPYQIKEITLIEKGEILVQESAVGSMIAVGISRVLQSPKYADKLQKGEIVITDMTSPDWDPILKKSAALITNKGARLLELLARLAT